MEKKFLLIAVLMLALCARGYAAGKYLRDVESRLLYGPIDEMGVKWVLPGGTYEVTEPAENEIKITKMLRSVIVSECDFTNASLSVAGAFFVRVCATNGLLFRVDTNNVNLDAFPLCALVEESRTRAPSFSISARYMSVFNLVHHVSRAFASPIGIDGATVTIGAALNREDTNVARQSAIRRIGCCRPE